MSPSHLLIVLTLLAGLASVPAIATPDGRLIATQGMGGAPCQSCHGEDGMGNGPAGFPRLAGLNADYLARQLRAFRDGSRSNPVMAPQATRLDDRAIQAVASYFAALPVRRITPAQATAEQLAAGRVLAEQGRWSDTIPACVQCHGPGGEGVPPHFPTLAGQYGNYLANQLKAWQQGTRRDDPLGLMAAVAGRLTSTDIQAVSAWLSRQTVPSEQP